ncbi:MAG: hypothetical protein II955_03640 [Clostridia bacterium]|nr:hypothetical protein [Clostridia bacterium]
MTNRDICNAAIRLAGETAPADVPDYLSRATSLLAVVCSECASLDAAYRRAHDLDDGTWIPCVSVNVDAEFPLCDVFSSPAAYGLAALLTLDENSTLSEALYARFASFIGEIRRELPAKPHPVTDVYHLI